MINPDDLLLLKGETLREEVDDEDVNRLLEENPLLDDDLLDNLMEDSPLMPNTERNRT